MRRGEDNRGKCAKNPADATPSGPLMRPPPSSPNFMPDALPVATLPIYPGLGQASNMPPSYLGYNTK